MDCKKPEQPHSTAASPAWMTRVLMVIMAFFILGGVASRLELAGRYSSKLLWVSAYLPVLGIVILLGVQARARWIANEMLVKVPAERRGVHQVSEQLKRALREGTRARTRWQLKHFARWLFLLGASAVLILAVTFTWVGAVMTGLALLGAPVARLPVPLAMPDWLYFLLNAGAAYACTEAVAKAFMAERRSWTLLKTSLAIHYWRAPDHLTQVMESGCEFSILLRGFSTEEPAVVNEPSTGDPLAPGGGTRFVPRRFDTRLTAFVQQALHVYVVANAMDPSSSDKVIPVFFRDADWKEAVRELIQRASVVLVIVRGSSEGLEFEMKELLAGGFQAKTLLLIEDGALLTQSTASLVSAFRQRSLCSAVEKRLEQLATSGTTPTLHSVIPELMAAAEVPTLGMETGPVYRRDRGHVEGEGWRGGAEEGR